MVEIIVPWGESKGFQHIDNNTFDKKNIEHASLT